MKLLTKKSPIVQTLIMGAVFFILIMISIWWVFFSWYENRLIDEQKTQDTIELELIKNSISHAMHRRTALFEGLCAYVESKPSKDHLESEINILMTGLHSHAKGVRVLALAPGGIQRYVHPLKGNELVVGHDILHDKRPHIQKAMKRALKTKKTIFNGPYELRQGGLALVVRKAIFFDDKFWGLAAMVIDIPPILEESGFMLKSNDMQLALSDIDGKMFYGDKDIYNLNPLILNVDLLDGHWDLAGLPINGWHSFIAGKLRFIQILSFIILLLITTIAALIFFRQKDLKLQIQRKTVELSVQIDAVRNSDERFNLAMEASQDGLYDWNLITNEIYYSTGWKKMLGYEDDELPNDFSIWENLTEPEDVKRSWEMQQELVNMKRDRFELEFKMKHKDGYWVDILSRAKAIFNEKDEAIRIVGTHVDITDQKLTRKKLRLEQERFQSYMKYLPGVAYIKDNEGRYIYLNETFEKLFKAKLEMWQGKTDMELKHFPDEVIKKIIQNDKQVVKINRHLRTIENVPFDDQMRNWLTIKFPISGKDEKETFVAGVAIDITDRIDSESALKKSENKFRAMMESMSDPLYICSPEKKISFMNPAMIKRLGRDATGETCYKAIHNLEQQCDWCVFDKVTQGKRSEITVLSPLDNRNYRVTNMPIEIDDKVSKMTIYKDITDFLDAVLEKEKAQARLVQAQKMESIGTLAGGIAHDFNNIMAIIVGNTELALDDVPKWNTAHSSLEEIKTASLRAKNIVKQLLSFSSKTDQKLQPIEIGMVIKDALKFLRSTIPTTININQDIQTTDEMILADPTQINQIIMNLCINASHAMEQTGGDLTVTVTKVIWDDNSAKDYPELKKGDYVKIIVSDTGPGIDPEIIDQIFDPYFTTKGVGKGSGMGLAVVQGIIISHEGAIAVDSKKGKGTKFIILFPLTTEKPIVEAQTNKEIPGGNETILFVDDEISITKMVQRMFERLGYKVQTATTPQDALDRFALNPDHFDLVISDMTMPRMTGVKLSEKLMDIKKDIPIIICTGHSVLVDEEKAKELGLAAFIMKPIDMKETAQTIRKVLDRKL